MKFGPVSLDEALGKILGHNIATPEKPKALRKGRRLTAEDIDVLRAADRTTVYVAELESGDVEEDDAARRIAEAVKGPGLRETRPHVGRVNLAASVQGVFQVDADRLRRLNELAGVTLATLRSLWVVAPRTTVATVKVIPFAIPEDTVLRAEEIAGECGPLLQVRALAARRVSLILSGSPLARQRVLESFDAPLRARIEALGSQVGSVEFVPLEEQEGEEELAARIREQAEVGAELIVLAGETAIMDLYDISPRAVRRAGGQVVSFGAPVDPGNLLMLAYLGEMPILGAPGCARSRKVNVVDWVLPPLLAGVRLNQADIAQLGHGGLLEDVPERPMPRGDRS